MPPTNRHTDFADALVRRRSHLGEILAVSKDYGYHLDEIRCAATRSAAVVGVWGDEPRSGNVWKLPCGDPRRARRPIRFVVPADDACPGSRLYCPDRTGG